MNVVVGIDFGTTNIYGAALINGYLEMVKPIFGKSTGVNYHDYDIVGKKIETANNYIFDVKRFIGRTYSDDLVQQICKTYPFEIVNQNGDIRFKIKLNNEECYKSPEDVCSEVLKQFRHVSGKNANIVLTVPAYFTLKQRQAMMEAAKLAEINVICLLEEPIAAFIGHLDEVKDTNGLSMVFHLGKYTFDITILDYSDCEIVVKCIDVDNMLGGNDFDEAMIDYFTNIRKLYNENNPIYRENNCEHDLTYKTQVEKTSLCFYENGNNIWLNISRKNFEEIAESLLKRCMNIVKRCLTKNNINKRDIKNVILVGENTTIPKIKELLPNFFENSKIVQSEDPEHTVAIGAALYAHIYKTPSASNNF